MNDQLRRQIALALRHTADWVEGDDNNVGYKPDELPILRSISHLMAGIAHAAHSEDSELPGVKYTE
jgi:hypothetical protein